MNTSIAGEGLFDETSLPAKEAFYSNLNIKNITDVDYGHGKRVFKEFNIKSFGEHHDLYVTSDELLLEDVFEIFEINVLKFMNLILLIFLSASLLAWKACLKKTRVKLGLLTDIEYPK